MTKPSSPAVPCRALPLVGELAAKAFRGEKWMTRRPVSAVNSLVDGGPPGRLFARLWLDGAWIDQGPSPAGNLGPYLKAPDPQEDTSHRVYSRVQIGDQFWIREPAEVVGLLRPSETERVTRVKLRYSDGQDSVWMPYPQHLAWDPIGGHKVPNGCFREAARTVVTVTGARPERVQDISETDILAEGVTVDTTAKLTGIPWSSMPTLDDAWRETIQTLYPGLWERNSWLWAWTWEPHRA